MRAIATILTTLLFVYFFSACTKPVKESYDGYDFQTARLKELVPLQPGKYIIYRTDSTVFPNFGRALEVHSFQEKQIVDALITDNQGRPSYRIFRYLRSLDGSTPWVSAGTIYTTIDTNRVEVNDNNMRIIKLVTPVRKDYSWKGNSYLINQPYQGQYDFYNDDGINNWNYTYTSVNAPVSINGNTVQGVTSISIIDDKFLADTIDIKSNKAQIASGVSSAYLRGNATDTTVITAAAPTQSGNKITIYNRSNFFAKLDGILINPDNAKIFEYVNGKWTFGYTDKRGIRKDTVMYDLPFGYKNFNAEQYAKNIGLVYQELIMWDYQYADVFGEGYKTGFGIKRTMIDHN